MVLKTATSAIIRCQNVTYKKFDSLSKSEKTILDNIKPSYQTTNRKEIRVRCPYCGDSKSNQSSAHMYG